MYKTPYILGYSKYQVVQDSFHQHFQNIGCFFFKLDVNRFFQHFLTPPSCFFFFCLVVDQSALCFWFQSSQRRLPQFGSPGLCDEAPKIRVGKGVFINPIGSVYGMYGRFTYIHHKNQLNVGEYASPMDPLGKDWSFFFEKYTP